MGHRALVGYRRPDGLYDLRYSHWGGTDPSLAAEISDDTPLADGAVSASLLTDSIARDRILTDYLDPCVHEMLFLVAPSAGYEVTPYHVCWLEWGDGHEDGRGALIGTEQTDEPVRTWFRATKTTLSDVIEMGVLSQRAAQAYLEARVCEEYAGVVYTYTGTGSGSAETDLSGAASESPVQPTSLPEGDRLPPDLHEWVDGTPPNDSTSPHDKRDDERDSDWT
ncbi:uncharacterized protein Nmag_1163 [Natrialba magadii ATCC 43099]|uniref:Uncharacterized protein n=1 Tax=Natrialba magadii (strain ATCC 43099 / DSM 3394 / CCM 3739 / CIP 104546 / IAM 13178 / JCM 8861 / NBRC 102185 / NCIMB 2190 / MS3) TaxID=547559 RepID=D3SS21_NATMM|nr:DUF6735 family protein [Natrialba magadii]ADD04747.1 uncharacterized protein Nmag_1163 [Natrialba magadii ATCC 43099]ELY24914.1 hypothetical protein C500_18338 [Natrialba magadii ATCC 43099]